MIRIITEGDIKVNLKIRLNKIQDLYYKYFAYAILIIGILGLVVIFINTDNLESRERPCAENGVLDLSSWDFEKDGLVKLNGEWEFYYNQILNYDDFYNNVNEVNLSGYINVPGRWKGYNVNGKAISGMGYGTYRLKVNMNDEKNNIMKGIILPYSLTSYKLMIDDDIICMNGKVGKDKNTAISEINTRITSFKTTSKEFEIILQISNFSFTRGGTFQPLYMGNYEDVLHKDKNSSLKDMFLFACLMIMGMYHIVLYTFLSKKKYTLHFGIFCLIAAVRIIFTYETLLINNFTKIDFGIFTIVNHGGIFLGIIFISNFFYEIYPNEFSKIFLITFKVYSISFIIIMLIMPYNKFASLLNICDGALIFIAIYFLKVFVKAVLNKREGSKIMLFGMVILFATVISDIWYVNNIKHSTSYGITSLGIIIFIFILAAMLSKMFSNAFLTVENLSQKLMSLDKLKDEFLANTSHELRTPLNGIIGIADSLLEGTDGQTSPILKRNLSIISSSARRLSSLVNDILDSSKLEHKDIHLNIRAINLKEVVEVVMSVFNSSLINKPFSIKNDIPDNLADVCADENRLQQIIYNLIGNAVKFTHEGEISIRARHKGEFMEITVEDTGIGIHKEKVNDIFKSFEQVDASISREYGGTGLGLSITQKLVNLHGGEIYCESELGKGSKFIFTLPLSKSKEEDSVSRSEAYNRKLFDCIEEKEVITLDIQPSEGKFKILVVDDEIVNLQVIINLLSLHNYSVAAAFNGKEALKLIENEEFDLIILDVMMPNMSGYEVCKIIREKFSLVGLPVLMLTAQSQITNLCMGFDCGANDYIIKPFEKAEMLTRIKTLITMKNAVNLSTMDELTGILNRRYIFELAKVILDEYQNNNQPFSTLMMDIDYFKKVNDTYGHAAGDEVLKEVALRCKEVLRTTDVFGRYGGEEFVVILPNTTIDTALEIAENIRENVGDKPIIIDSLYELNVTISLGAAQIRNKNIEVHNIFNEADLALYAAKEKGRNCTESAQILKKS